MECTLRKKPLTRFSLVIIPLALALTSGIQVNRLPLPQGPQGDIQ